jgi:hypothetical protein
MGPEALPFPLQIIASPKLLTFLMHVVKTVDASNLAYPGKVF